MLLNNVYKCYKCYKVWNQYLILYAMCFKIVCVIGNQYVLFHICTLKYWYKRYKAYNWSVIFAIYTIILYINHITRKLICIILLYPFFLITDIDDIDDISI